MNTQQLREQHERGSGLRTEAWLQFLRWLAAQGAFSDDWPYRPEVQPKLPRDQDFWCTRCGSWVSEAEIPRHRCS